MSRLLTTAGGEEQEGGVAEVGGDGPMRDALTTQVGTNGSLSGERMVDLEPKSDSISHCLCV